MLRSIARICYRQRWATLGIWVLILIGVFAISITFGGESRTEFSLPGSETQEAVEILEAGGFGDRAGIQAQIVFEAENGVRDPAVQTAMEALFQRIEAEVADVSIISPYSPEGQRQITDDGRIAYAEVNFAERNIEEYTTAAEQIVAMRDEMVIPGAQLELGGEMFIEFSEPSSELIGVIAAIIILLVAFGSLLAMSLPIITALFGVGASIALVGLVANVIAVPDFTTAVAAMIGIGVGIDYSLLIITRFRKGLHDGLEPEAAVLRAADTAGRSVLFAGITVVISVMGLFALNLDTFRAVAVAAALAVLMTMMAALTLLPALLGFARERIDKLGLPHRRLAEGREQDGMWQRWSRFIQRRPWPPLLAALTLLLVLTIPLLDLRLGFSDAGSRAETDTTRRAYDLLSVGFGPGFNSPLILVAELPGGAADLAAFDTLTGSLNGAPGVAYASPPQPNDGGSTAISIVVPTTSPQDPATTDLVKRLRSEVIPPATAGSTANVLVGGAQAGVVDFVDYSAVRMPIFIGAVLLLSFLLLMAVFRSVLVAFKAIIMNMLSLGASFGVIVAVFQWGWAKDLVGVSQAGPIEAWAPLMIFAIVFGLSMDYEVFLLSRIKEEYDRTGDNANAVSSGLAATARVITAAAAIMICVFGSFVLSSETALKLLGFGMAVAIFVDATIVRMIVVPATMELLGDRNWWLPGWLKKVLPNITVDVPDEEPTPGMAAATANGGFD
ncbi:MAG TPA: MMPL family transporter [Thermomicrobiales bacterium]|nr:MMPL family transporter [Thermomicrobiales bacterium]